MPLGISERKIERAYGPLDLSGVYKPILATAQKIYADEEKKVTEAQKQLATTSAEINKLRAGVREADLGEITRMYNRWAEIERQLANNPNLIRRNPDTYGQLKNESNTLYGNMIGVINESKQQSKYELDAIKTMSNPNNTNKFRDNALVDYQSRVLRTPVTKLRGSMDNDLTSYFNPMIDGSKFYNALPQRIESTLRNIDLPGTDKDQYGQISMLKLEKMPEQGVIYQTVFDTLKGNTGGKTELFAEQQLDLMKPEEKRTIIERYNAFYQKDANGKGEFSKYQLPEQKIIDFSAPKINKTQEFVELMTAKEFLNRLPVVQKGKPEFPSKAAELKFKESIKKVAGDKEEKEQVTVDLYTPAVEIISKTTSKPQNIGKNVMLNQFSAEVQDAALNKAKELYKDTFTNNYDDLSLNYSPAKKAITIHTRVDIKDGDKIIKKKGDVIGELSQSQLTTIGNKPLGTPSVRAGQAQVQQAKAVPRFNMK
jgi:hypothetical protein